MELGTSDRRVELARRTPPRGLIVSHPGRGLLRIARGGILGVCCGVLALLGHLVGGGAAPPLPALAACTVLVGSGLSVLADRRRYFPHILGAAVTAQIVFHVAFSLTARPGTGTAGVHAGLAGAAPGHHADDVSMVAGHLVAALAMAWLLAHGEAVLWAVFDLFGFVRLPVPSGAVDLGELRLPRPRTDVAPSRALSTGWIHPRRGPPPLAATRPTTAR
jgi:hypothetical protein